MNLKWWYIIGLTLGVITVLLNGTALVLNPNPISALWLVVGTVLILTSIKRLKAFPNPNERKWQ